MSRSMKRSVLILAAAIAPLGSTCAINTRDAVVGGAMDFVSGTTADLLSQLFALLFNLPTA